MLLTDYQDPSKRYLLSHDLDSPVIEKGVSNEADPEMRGFAAVRKVGIRYREQVFAALFLNMSEQLIMRICSNAIGVESGHLTVSRSYVFPFRNRFVALVDSALFVKFDYFFFEWESWPDNGDIFSYFVEGCGTSESISKTTKFWKAKLKGFH